MTTASHQLVIDKSFNIELFDASFPMRRTDLLLQSLMDIAPIYGSDNCDKTTHMVVLLEFGIVVAGALIRQLPSMITITRFSSRTEANIKFVIGYVTDRFPNVDIHMSVSSDNAEIFFAVGFTKRNRTRKCCMYSSALIHIVLPKRIRKTPIIPTNKRTHSEMITIIVRNVNNINISSPFQQLTS